MTQKLSKTLKKSENKPKDEEIDGKISQKSIREFFLKNQTIRNQENIENVSEQSESEYLFKQKYLDDLVASTKKKMNKKINHFAYDVNYVVFENIAAKRKIVTRRNHHLNKMKRFSEKIIKY